MRASPWHARKGAMSGGKGKGNPSRARQLFKKKGQEGVMEVQEGLNEMTKGLSNISMSRGGKASHLEEEKNSYDGELQEREGGYRKGDSQASQQARKITWKRLSREGEARRKDEKDGERKRLASELNVEKGGVTKRLKGGEGDDTVTNDDITAAGAVMQPCREP